MKSKLLFVLGLSMTSIVIYYIALWIVLFKSNTGTREDLIILYQSYYPDFIMDSLVHSVAFVLLCLASFFCFQFVRQNEKAKAVKVSSSIMMAVNMVLMAWLLFTLM